MTSAPKLTDRKSLALHRARAARTPVNFLHEAVADEVQERLNEVNKSFTVPLLIGNVTAPFVSLFPDAPKISDTPELEVKATHDLVLHCFGLHWADDPIGQMVQSRLALKPDGLFLGVMFGGATLHELRTSLAEAESKLRGVCRRVFFPWVTFATLAGLFSARA